MCFKRKKRLPERTLNIWNRHEFAMAGLGAWGTASGIRNIARGDDAIAVTEQIAKRLHA